MKKKSFSYSVNVRGLLDTFYENSGDNIQKIIATMYCSSVFLAEKIMDGAKAD